MYTNVCSALNNQVGYSFKDKISLLMAIFKCFHNLGKIKGKSSESTKNSTAVKEKVENISETKETLLKTPRIKL